MVNQHNSSFDVFSEMLADSRLIDKKKPMNIMAALIMFPIVAVISGLILSMVILPVFLPVASAPETAKAYWDQMDTELPEPFLPQRSVMLDDEGNEFAQFYSQNRVVVDIDDISSNVIDALIATEDQQFFTHGGVDWFGVARAALNNTVGANVQGGSTITQQLVKNTLIVAATNDVERLEATEPAINRKVKELRYAIALEEQHSKEEILSRYLNTIPYSHGVYGIESAANFFFSTTAKDLNLTQAATLVGVINAPSMYDPINNPEGALDRRNTVLRRMHDQQIITREEYREAIKEPLNLEVAPPTNGCAVSQYPYYCQHVLNTILEDDRLGSTREEREYVLHAGGLTITTALNRTLQDDMQNTVDTRLGRDNRVGIGVASIQPGTGKILSMVQNRSWGDPDSAESGEINTEVIYPTSRFQPGSTFKIFTAIAALESGFNPSTVINAPAVYNPSYMNTPDRGISNISRSGTGNLTLKDALRVSSNTFFATLQEHVGVLEVREAALMLHVPIPGDVGSRDASFTLGTKEVSPLDIANTYATVAADGVYCYPTAITDIRRVDGIIYPKDSTQCYQAISPQTAHILQDALIDVVENGTGTRAKLDGITSMGKTGTTTNHAAVWYVGSTADISTAVWMGDPRGGFKHPLTQGVKIDGRTTYRVYGGEIAADMWKTLHQNAPIPTTGHVLNPSPSRPGNTSYQGSVPNFVGMRVGSVIAWNNAQKVPYRITFNSDAVDDDMIVVAQTPAGGTRTFNAMFTHIKVDVAKPE